MRAFTLIAVVTAIVAAIAVTLRHDHSQSAPDPKPLSLEWVVDPQARAPSLPTAGRSLFDIVTIDTRTERPVYDIPFPFEALMTRLRQRGALAARDLKVVLIPAGRSLQRAAAAPEFFRFPRVVVAIDGEPTTAAAPLLKDRLYLGYQEKAAIIEVISYNEVAGRFEFQIVKDYRAGATPRVLYANRTICTTCHQNAAPIFSQPLWDETQANDAIATALQHARREFYGIAPRPASDTAYAIDNATDRANALSLYQRLWAECIAGDVSGERRAGILREVLRYGLSAHAMPGSDQEQYRHIAAHCARAWQNRWPRGLALPNPNIPNRNPFLQRIGDGAVQPLAALDVRGALSRRAIEAEVPATFEPLTPRPPLDIWQASDPAFADFVRGLSGFIARSDYIAIDRALRHRVGASARTLDINCTRRVEGTTTTRVDCRSPLVSLQLYLDTHDASQNRLSALQFGAGPRLTDIVVRSRTRRGALVLEPIARDMAFRIPSGTRIDSVTLQGDRGYLALTDDFSPIESLVPAVGTTMSDAVFRRADALTAVDRVLGGLAAQICCAVPARPAPVAAEIRDDTPLTAALAPNLDREPDLFRHYCGRCHATEEHFPPNFLHGADAAVERQLQQCAERIYFRLSMWAQPHSSRAKTPMPPTYALAAHALDEAHWINHPDLARLRAAVVARIEKESPHVAAPTLLTRDYTQLRACLAPTASIH